MNTSHLPPSQKPLGFWKLFLASLLGSFTALVVIFALSMIILVGGIVSMASMQESTVSVKPNSILHINVTTLNEVQQSTPFDMSSFGPKGPKNLSLTDAIAAIKTAEKDKNIKGIYLNTMDAGGGLAATAELRRAIEQFKKTGKFVISYADIYSQKGYYLASAANELYVNPVGTLVFDGLAQHVMYMKSALKKLGVEMMVFKVGTYKSAVEPFLLDEMSDANREQITSYLSDIWNRMVTEVATDRKLSPDSLLAIADQAPSTLDPKDYIELGLVDAILYKDEVMDRLCELVGKDKPSDLNLVSLYDYRNSTKSKDNKRADGTVGVLFAEGSIKMNQADKFGSSPSAITEKLIKDIEELAEDDDINAIVIRVNSPGGSAYVSEQIWRALTIAQQKKPVIASMGDYAASGGYYISSAAKKIVAEPNTLTGSIGIFGLFPNTSGLFNKAGLSIHSVSTAQYSDLGNTGRPMTEPEKQLIQNAINRGYQTFLSRVAEGRNMTLEQVDSIGQGRVWTGQQAKALGLVDAIGGLDVAVAIAAKEAGLKSYNVYHKGNTVSFLDSFWNNSATEMSKVLLKNLFTSQELEMLRQLREQRDEYGVLTRMPFIEVF